MKYKSIAQKELLAKLLKQGKISQKVIDKYDSDSKDVKLPQRVMSNSRPKKSSAKPYKAKPFSSKVYK